MSAPPTTRSSRSRYSSPAVVGGAARNGSANDASGNSRDRGRDKGKVKAKENSGGVAGDPTASRSASTERSRRFMESWIEPERVRMTSFQEDGLIRQGVLETMEPLGTRPKPSVIKKLVGMGREGSPSASIRSGKVGSGKKIILKRKNGVTSLGVQGPSDVPSGTVSPNPSTTTATPQLLTATSPPSTPALAPTSEPVTAPEHSSPTPTPRVEQLDTLSLPLLSDAVSDLPEMHHQEQVHESSPPADRIDSSASPTPQAIAQPPPHTNSTDSPSLNSRPTATSIPFHLPSLTNTTYDPSNPFLPDPIKSSVEEFASAPNLPTTPRSTRSIQSTNYDSDDYFKRESSVQSIPQVRGPPKSMRGTDENQAVGSSSAPPAGRAQQHSVNSQSSLGPHYTEAESNRIIGQKDIVKKALDAGADEALSHYDYVTAYSFRMAYEQNQSDARFLLQTEAIFKQSATKEAAGEWARMIQRYKETGAKGRTALRYFVPEAESDKDYEPKEPLPAPYAHLVSIDMTEVRNLKKTRRPGETQLEQSHSREQPQSAAAHVVEGVNEDRRNEYKAEPERVNTLTPPRNSKRQKIQRDSSSAGTARKAPVPTTATTVSSASAGTRTKNNMGKSNINGASPLRRTTRAGSNASDVSSLSSLRSATPIPEALDEAAQPSKRKASKQAATRARNGDVESPQAGAGGFVDSTETGDAALPTAGVGSATGASAQAPPVIGLRRAPTRRARNANSTAAASSSLPSDPDPSTHSHSHSQPDSQKSPDHNNSNPASTSFHQQPHNTTNQQKVAQTNATLFSSSSASKSKHQQTPNSHQTQQQTKRSQRGMPDFTPSNRLDAGDEEYARRKAAREKTLKMTDDARRETGDSFIRGSAIGALSPPERPLSSSSLSSVGSDQLLDPMQEEPEMVMTKGKGKGRAAKTSGRATRASKRTHDEMDDDIATPFSEDFGREASTVTASRATTPRPAKKPKTGRRLKQSPVKSKTAQSAGAAAGGAVPSRAAARASPALTDAATHNQEDNDDFCSACGGNGNLVCCDGCTKSFHCTCHDPPVNPLEDAAWFCLDCTIKRNSPNRAKYTGPFGALIANVEKKHSKAFILPSDIRNHFEGVRTGADGEYEDYVPPVVKPKKRKTDEKEEFDYYQLADADDNPVLCHSCQQSAATKRPIIPCSVCGLFWHADCLDPIKTQPPNVKTFVCPCHVDDLLAKVPAQLGPAHKHRKVRGAPEILYAYRRGNVNDGHIVIEDDEDEDDQIPSRTGFRDPVSWGRVTRVRGSGVKDDFLSKFRTQQPQSQSQSVYYREDAEQLFGGALDLMAFSRKAREERQRASVPPAASVKERIAHEVALLSEANYEAESVDELDTRLRRMEKLRQEVNDQIEALSKRLQQSAPAVDGGDHPEGEPEAANTVNHSSDGGLEGMEDDEDDRETVILAPEPVVESATEATAEDPAASSANEAAEAQQAPDADAEGSPIATTQPAAITDENPDANKNDSDPVTVVNVDDVKDEVMDDDIVKGTVEKTVDSVVESALTPVSDIHKESNELPAAVAVTNMPNGIKTPETTVADNATSPVAEAEAMDLD